MNAMQVFTLAIRLAGLWLILNNLPGLPRSIYKLWSTLLAGEVVATVQAIISIVWVYAVAIWFLRGAPWLAKLAFPKASSSGLETPS